MKKVFIWLAILCPYLFSDNIGDKIDKLIPVLIQVESGGDLEAVGDNGKAIGVLQLWNIYIQDVNRVYKTKYSHSDAKYYYNSIEIAVRYLTFWGKQYEKRTGKEATLEILAKLHNGGPYADKSKGQKLVNVNNYWKKVKKELDNL